MTTILTGDCRETLKVLSLFSGIGGFDLAFRNVGMVCNSVVEIDDKCQTILTRHFPEAKLFDDVRKVGKDTHERKSIDLICGGFPCQDVSIAGKRAGIAGERSGLWFEFARIIDKLEPQWVVIENVPGLLSSNHGRDFAQIIRWLVKRGYGVAWRVLDAQYFGVPQRRRRVFIVASFGNGSAAEVLFESESMSGNTPQSREAGKEVAFSLRANPSHSGDKGDGGINTTLVPSLVSNGDAHSGFRDKRGLVQFTNMFQTGSNGNPAKVSDTLDTLDTLASFAILAHGQANAEVVSDGSPSLTTNHEAPILWEMSHADEAVRENGEVVPTLQARMGTGGNQVPMVGVRRLMPIECERLQGFPDGWTDGQSDTARYRQLGNAVAVPVVEWIEKRITNIPERSPDVNR